MTDSNIKHDKSPKEVMHQGRIQDLIKGGAPDRDKIADIAQPLCEQSEPFSAWGLGPTLGPQKYFITKYAFSPFWGTFLYYF